MEDESIKTAEDRQLTESQVLGEIVGRIRDRLRRGEAFELAGKTAEAGRERDTALDLLGKLEERLETKVARYALSALGSKDHLYFEDAVIKMVGVLRACVCNISPAFANFEDCFSACFFKRCRNAIRDCQRENALIGKHAPGEDQLVSLTPVNGSQEVSDPRSAKKSTKKSAVLCDSSFEDSMAEGHVWDAVNRLPEDLRLVAVRFFQGASYAEIAAEQHVTERTIRNRHLDGLERVRTDLNQ